jgi:hypothetical protein
MLVTRGRVSLPIAGLIVALTLLACDAVGADRQPTVAEAQGYLERVVALAKAHDFDGLCAIADGNCRVALDFAGRDNVPADPPTVVGTRFVPTTTNGNTTSVGGVVLELCGSNASGTPYRSEMLVFRYDGQLSAINAVYWQNVGVSSGGVDGSARTNPGPSRPPGPC